jgi:hypothetical protein
MTSPVDHFSGGDSVTSTAGFEDSATVTAEQRDSLFNLVPLEPLQWQFFRFEACGPHIEHVVRVRIAPGAPESDLPFMGLSTSDAPHIVRQGEIITEIRGNEKTFSRQLTITPGEEARMIRIALFSERRYGATPYELSVLFAGTPGCPVTEYVSAALALGPAAILLTLLTYG